MGKGTLLNGEGDFVPVLHVPLKSYARGFRIKATPVDQFIGCVCLKMILWQSRGGGDFVPEGESQGERGISGLFLGILKNSRLKNLPMKKIKAIF